MSDNEKTPSYDIYAPQEFSASELANAYIRYLRTGDAAFEWSNDWTINLNLHKRWADIWNVLLAILVLPEPMPDKVLADVAAGLLEDLLNGAGYEYIDRIEHLARENATFGRMLTGVWPSQIPAEVWERVVNFCRSFSNPLDQPYMY